MGNNPFASGEIPPHGAARDYVPVTPNDDTNLDKIAMALFVETGGAVAFIPVGNPDVTRTVTVPDNGWILCGAFRVKSTGTTATGIHALVSF